MTAAELLSAIKEAVARSEGSAFTRDDFLRFLEGFDRLVSGAAEERGLRLQAYSLEVEKWKVQLEERSRTFHEFNGYAITTGQNAIRGALLVNGGAAVAALAFTGNALNRLQPETVDRLAQSMGIFCAGVFLAVFAQGLAYLIQRFILNELNASVEASDADLETQRLEGVAAGKREEPESSDSNDQIDASKKESARLRRRAKKWGRLAGGLTAVAVVAVLSSYAAFGMGSLKAVKGFRHGSSPSHAVASEAGQPMAVDSGGSADAR